MDRTQRVTEEAPDKSRIWLGVGLGCGGVVLFLLFGLVTILLNIDDVLQGTGNALRDELRTAYEQIKKDGKVPEEHAPLYEELLSRTLRPDSGMFAPGMVSGVLIQTVEDGVVTADELILLEGTLDFLQRHPSPNPVLINQYMEQHPELAAAVERIEKARQDQGSRRAEPVQ